MLSARAAPAAGGSSGCGGSSAFSCGVSLFFDLGEGADGALFNSRPVEMRELQ